LWASTSTKDPRLPDTLYVDSLIGPDTVNTLPEATIAEFEDHGQVSRSIDADVDEAAEVMGRLGEVGVDMSDVGLTLEEEGAAGFQKSLEQVLRTLDARAHELAGR
jgi:transaldolase